ncbi:tRNA uridine-5-carboxymethylaminomethyl(34) synthesis enzyme MnmG [Acetobacteroides hydrogenigenes]|uniref:tRNA uridine 5-carboxymethylaminomethyl modification enzyme MnmG n=1 Tax=Acetobacteroides hydrogenigenes TaxID=979970 RepID=A0A4R2EX65_9BACT|nr:tRNA uridine-5-carboxymethylaminomethyl(34) synthesis enzyme MnmG [Acetobacteroides hydrogenigenes]TCN72162.1 tRNA uridine 5-carboxymethylaminomethyl modification enzyme [Acetobacteroides hydrogenigenes]
MVFNYDVVVVGAGHAGCEAAAAAANLGAQTLLITMDMTKMGQMSCNPAMGGIAKGQIVREIDALGGYSGIVTDSSSIQFRMLNRSKGPAMWSPRAQCDRSLFSLKWREMLENTPNLFFWQDSVVNLLIEDSTVKGVHTALGVDFTAKSVVLTTGTFMNGLMHVGRAQLAGGRSGDMASYGITEQLRQLGLEVGRMKTGTPARIDGRTIDYSKVVAQEGDANPEKFSFLDTVKPLERQLPCYITYTNTDVHETLRAKFDESPLFNGTIKSIGPRYCPSIEDKVRTFADKDQHQLFLEPEGWDTNEYYINGFSSSLPLDVQVSALTKIPGLENARIFRPGYAIEYDYFQPTQLYHSLETKLIRNLFFAGQINGTTGYEEAAGQGLIAGINAARSVQKQECFILSRESSYIGVLIDDLVTKGVDEPYRMFTSRAEYRILLRQDNADERLTPIGIEIGLVKKDREELFKYKQDSVEKLVRLINKTSVTQDQINDLLVSKNTPPINQTRKLVDILLRPQIVIKDLLILESIKNFYNTLPCIQKEILQQADIKVKYSGYIDRERIIANKLSRLEDIRISDCFDFNKLQSLSTEARQKLSKIKPKTIGQASRIPGVSPSDINVLLVFLGR